DDPATAHTPATTAAGGRTRARTNSPSNNVCMETSSVGGGLGLCLVAEAAAVDAIAQGRALDLQQLRGLRFVAAAHLERPENEIRFELPQPIVERHRRRRTGRQRRRQRRIRRLRAGAEQNAGRQAADANGAAGAGLRDALARVLE